MVVQLYFTPEIEVTVNIQEYVGKDIFNNIANTSIAGVKPSLDPPVNCKSTLQKCIINVSDRTLL